MKSENKQLLTRLLLCLLPLVLMIFVRLFKLNNEADVKVLMRLMLMTLAGCAAYLVYKKKLTAETTVTLIILGGIILRWGYTMYTGPFVRAHDIGMNNESGVGHWGYLYQIMHGHLPPSNEYQFYQPPLFYMLSAVFIRIGMFFTRASEWSGLLYLSQLLSCIASCVALIFCDMILKKLNAGGRVRVIAAMITAVYPAQILASARVNNDVLAFMFMVLALYFTLLWHKDQKLKYIIGIALSIGFGMMSKINCGLIALVTGPVMLYHFIKRIRMKNMDDIKTIIIQFAVFAIICFPLGLWYPIRNYILFDQPLNFVHILGENSVVYTGDASFVEKWLHIPFLHFIERPYTDMAVDAGVFMLLIKTGVHGEFSYDGMSNLLAWGLDYVHAALLLLVFVSVIVVMFKYKTLDKTQKYSAFWVWLLMFASYIQFNFAYPYSCTADFRYMLLWQTVSAVFIAYFMDYCKKNKGSKPHRYSMYASVIITALFCGMCVMHFC